MTSTVAANRELKIMPAKFWVGKPEERRPLGRPRHRWKDNIKMDFFGNRVWGYGLDSSGSG
jgi:hypothetical protein